MLRGPRCGGVSPYGPSRAGGHTATVLDIIGERLDNKWKGSILFLLLDDKKRFSDFQKRLTKITQRTLTQQLRDLERDGMVSDERLLEKVWRVAPPDPARQIGEQITLVACKEFTEKIRFSDRSMRPVAA